MKLFRFSTFMMCIYASVLFLIPSVLTAAEPEGKPRLPLAMEVFLKKPETRQYELHIHLTNISGKTVTVDVHELPWVPPNDSKWLKAVRMNRGHSSIEQRVFRGKFGSRTIRLLPGESIQNSLRLNTRLPTLLKDIATFGVQLHWDCPPESLRFGCQTGSPNTITIPQEDPGHPDQYVVDKDVCNQFEHALGLIKNFQHEEVLFIVTSTTVLTDLARTQALLYRVDDYVRACKPTWTNSWEVSFFTDKKFAGFISDLQNQRYFEKGLWQQANIGQYSSQIRTLFRFPWIKKKSDSVYLSVYRPKSTEQTGTRETRSEKPARP